MELAQAGLIGYSVHIEHVLKGTKQHQNQEYHTNSKSYQRCYIHFQAEPPLLWFNLSWPQTQFLSLCFLSSQHREGRDEGIVNI